MAVDLALPSDLSPAKPMPYLADVAQLEWHCTAAFQTAADEGGIRT